MRRFVLKKVVLNGESVLRVGDKLRVNRTTYRKKIIYLREGRIMKSTLREKRVNK